MQQTQCPISIGITPSGYGWADVKFNICNDKFNFAISYVGASIGDFVERVYYLSADFGHDDVNYNVMEYAEKDLPFIDYDGTPGFGRWIDLPWRTEIYWDGESSSVTISMERPVSNDIDFDLTIKFDIFNEEKFTHTYTVRYRDFCYAVSKGVTELLVKYGIIGYHESSWLEDINIRHLLWIKSFALQEYIEQRADKRDGIYRTNLEQELALLVKPMP